MTWLEFRHVICCVRCVEWGWKLRFMPQWRTPYLFIDATSAVDAILFLVAGYARRRMSRNW